LRQEISIGRTRALRERFMADGEGLLRMNGATKSGIDGVCLSYSAPVNTPNVFSDEIKTGEITAQNSSGRCWLFAATNVMRLEVMKKCELETFELSQAYLFFWDKLEKANFFLESILDTLGEAQGSRLLSWLLASPFGDGGQWDMMVALVEKYGVVPKAAMPESFSSGNSGRMNKFLTLKAREFAKELRDAHGAGASRERLEARKGEMLDTFYRMLCICLGAPPERFDFECRNKDGKFTRAANVTPLEFYDGFVGKKLDEYVSLINSPTADKPFYSTFTVEYLGNVVGGRPIRYLNLPSESLKRAAAAQLGDGEAVWFGCDVGQMLDRERGLMDMDAYDAEGLFGAKFGLDKAARLDYGESLMTHAMVLTGMNVAGGAPNRWKVENSWGDKSGEKGWFRMSDAWFDEYVYQVVVNIKYLTGAERDALKKPPIALRPWDPMGSLA
jgi:bleomycin hydrolase